MRITGTMVKIGSLWGCNLYRNTLTDTYVFETPCVTYDISKKEAQDYMNDKDFKWSPAL